MAKFKLAPRNPQDAKTFPEFVSALEEKYPKFRQALHREQQTLDQIANARRVLREIRKEHAVSQTELAKRIGTTQSRVSAIENGGGDIGLATVFDYLKALDVTPADGFKRLAKNLLQSVG